MRPAFIVKKPPMPPHVCFKCKCGEHARNFFVDIGADTEFDGTIYLCESCMEDLGRSTDMFYSREVFENKISAYLVELSELKEMSLEYTQIKESWGEHFPISLTNFIGTLKKVDDGTSGDSDSSIRKSDVDKTESDVGDNVIELVPDITDSNRSYEEFSGQAVTAPVIPLFS